MGILLSKRTDDIHASVLCDTGDSPSLQNRNDSKMSKLGQQQHMNEADMYEMMIESEALLIQHIDALHKENGIDFRCALHVRLSIPEQNSDFSDVNLDPVRSIRTSAPPPPPKRFQRRRKTALHGLNEDL